MAKHRNEVVWKFLFILLEQIQTMNRVQVLAELTTLLNEVLERTDVEINEATTAKDVDGWDSLNHAIFIGEIQKHFSVKFALREVIGLKQVGNICDLVIERIENK